MAIEAEALRAPPEGALKLARQEGGATGELRERIAWALDPEAFQIWERDFDRRAGAPSKGPTWDQLAVAGRRAAARATASMLISGPLAYLIHRSALAEDPARAAEGKAELEGWKRVAMIAAVALEPLRMAGTTKRMAPSSKEAIDLAVVAIRLAVTDGLLPPAGGYAEITAPAKALLEAADANR